MSNSQSGGNGKEEVRPKKGTRVILTGLKAKPELNGSSGVVIQNFNSETGRCAIQLDDGEKIKVKPINISIPSLELELEQALAKLVAAGGTEEEDPDDDDDAQPSADSRKDIKEYVDELIAVGDARYKLGQYDKAGGIFYRAYYAKMHSGGGVINSPDTFPVAHKMLQAWSQSDSEHSLRMAHGMAEQTCMMPGCPRYIQDDMKALARTMRNKGMEVQSMMSNLRGF